MAASSTSEIDVGKIAHLARLELTDAEVAEFQAEFAGILHYVRQLGEVDVEGVEPTAHATLITNVVRPDAAREPLDQQPFLKNAPALTDDDLLLVPKVLADEGGA